MRINYGIYHNYLTIGCYEMSVFPFLKNFFRTTLAMTRPCRTNWIKDSFTDLKTQRNYQDSFVEPSSKSDRIKRKKKLQVCKSRKISLYRRDIIGFESKLDTYREYKVISSRVQGYFIDETLKFTQCLIFTLWIRLKCTLSLC